MFNALISIYDWYHETIEPTCPPPSDTNILCPIYYGKVNISSKANAVEISMTPAGQVGLVRKFDNDPRTENYGERYALTPSCIQHRRNGANKKDAEYSFFNKFSVILGEDRATWLKMYSSWVSFHKDNNLPGDITPIAQIVDFVATVDPDEFLNIWNADGIIDDAGRTQLVFTMSGRKIFDENPLLWESYKIFYEQWCRKIYDVRDGISALTGQPDLDMRMQDGSPVAFGIAYANGRKMIMKPQAASTTLDTVHIFNVQKGFNSYSAGLRDMWKLHTVFDYLSEQQQEWDIKSRNLFFFVPDVAASYSYDESLRYREMLTALKQFHEGYKWQVPPLPRTAKIGYIYWTSSSNGRSSISEFQTLPIVSYVENIERLYSFFEEKHKFCLYKVPNLLETESNFVKKLQHELIHTVLCSRPIPDHVIRRLVAKSLTPEKTSATDQASRHSGYGGKYAEYYYRNVLETTIGLLLYNEQLRTREGTVGEMSLDRANRNRSYLYGRLVAIYQRAEEVAMGENSRVTNAEKSFNSVSNRPVVSITALSKKVSPYMNKLANNRPNTKIFIDRELQEVWGGFSTEDVEDTSPLDHMFLVGYYCQRQEFFKPKDNKVDEASTESEAADEQ